MDPWVISNVLQPNLDWTGFLDLSVVHAVPVENFLKQAQHFVGMYHTVVVEYPLRTNMLDSCGCLMKITDRRFGRTHLAIYGPTWAQKKRK
ncbi:unnamed protein product [Linum tenue]|uniref:Uncharacterized protein n=1 Tax=Linum tenue TaxID=586396 RepID=A0AAV0NB10_9ROSI|nr:unnamed protein product [Linum tenue]